MASRREGVTLGPYRIIQQVGLGGMATVYKAYQPSMERYVALKILPEHYARDPKFTQRFIREARTIAQLEHKNILPVHDFGEEGGVTYLAMRYLEGGTLKDVLELGHLTLADAADILSQVCSALDYAHRQGVVHRDVKPSNVMIDDEGEAYLTDFGIAKVLESTAHLTGEGAAMGTPAYMAPEQVLGKKVDGRADIYALGIMLYEMVVGRVPYQAETPMAVAVAHIHEPLPLPRQFDPTIPEPIEAVILKALAKDPDDRYQTANQLSAALNEAITEAGIDPTQTRLRALATEARLSRAEEIATYDVPVSPFAPTAEPAPARRRWPLLAGALALVTVVVVTGLLFLSSRVGPGAEQVDLESAAQTYAVTQTTERLTLAAQVRQTTYANARAIQTAQATQSLTPMVTSTPEPTINATLYGCKPRDTLVFARDFEDGDTTGVYGNWRVEEAPGGSFALHAMGPGNFWLAERPVTETRIALRVHPVKGRWWSNFRIDPSSDEWNAYGTHSDIGGGQPLKVELHFGNAHYDLAFFNYLVPNQWASLELIWEGGDTLILVQDGTEVGRYVERNLILEKGAINLSTGDDDEAWFDDLVVCGENSD